MLGRTLSVPINPTEKYSLRMFTTCTTCTGEVRVGTCKKNTFKIGTNSTYCGDGSLPHILATRKAQGNQLLTTVSDKTAQMKMCMFQILTEVKK